MRIAVISDIHGNLSALNAVLDDIEKKGVDSVCCAGDLVGYGPFPNEVIDLLREKHIASVMGNYDYAVGNSRIVCRCRYKDEEAAQIGAASLQWTTENVTGSNREYLRMLPFEIAVGTDNCGVRLIHGSPRRFYEYLDKDLDDRELNKLLFECVADVLVCGHTHIPYARWLAEKLVVNAGSVGKPRGGDPRASYCIIKINGKPEAEICYVEYDIESTARAIIEKGLPAKLADNLRTAAD